MTEAKSAKRQRRRRLTAGSHVATHEEIKRLRQMIAEALEGMHESVMPTTAELRAEFIVDEITSSFALVSRKRFS